MFLYTGPKQIPDIVFDLTELLGSVNREAQIKAEGKNVSYAVDWERADLPFICLLGNPVYAARTIRAMQREDAETVPIFAMSARGYREQQDRRNERTPDEAAGREKASGGDPEISQKSKKIEEERFLCFLFPEAGSFQHVLVIRALIQSTISCLSKNNRYHFVIGVVVEGGDGSLHGFAA